MSKEKIQNTLKRYTYIEKLNIRPDKIIRCKNSNDEFTLKDILLKEKEPYWNNFLKDLDNLLKEIINESLIKRIRDKLICSPFSTKWEIELIRYFSSKKIKFSLEPKTIGNSNVDFELELMNSKVLVEAYVRRLKSTEENFVGFGDITRGLKESIEEKFNQNQIPEDLKKPLIIAIDGHYSGIDPVQVNSFFDLKCNHLISGILLKHSGYHIILNDHHPKNPLSKDQISQLIGKQKLIGGWKEFELGEVLQYEQPGDYIVGSDEYNDDYETPVLTAGKSFILGYTNEKQGIYNKLPVIIFDDFTTANHFVTFPFKVKSSAMKLLTPKMKNINLKFVFCMMKGLHHNTITHKRYWISEFQPKKIPIPIKEDGTLDMKKQEKIIKFIEEAEKSKEWRKEADDLTKDFLKSVFLEMFGDKFEEVELGDKRICDQITDGFHNSMEKDLKGIPLIKVENIHDGKINFENADRISRKAHEKEKKRCNPEKGNVLLTCVGTIGRTAIINSSIEFNIVRSVALLKPSKLLNSEYLEYSLHSPYSKMQMEKLQNSTTRKGLYLNSIKKIKIPLPPIELQNKFASIVKEVEAMKEQQKHSKNHIDKLFNALMQKAFKGELII